MNERMKHDKSCRIVFEDIYKVFSKIENQISTLQKLGEQ